VKRSKNVFIGNSGQVFSSSYFRTVASVEGVGLSDCLVVKETRDGVAVIPPGESTACFRVRNKHDPSKAAEARLKQIVQLPDERKVCVDPFDLRMDADGSGHEAKVDGEWKKVRNVCKAYQGKLLVTTSQLDNHSSHARIFS
jgi:hypothetical protein